MRKRYRGRRFFYNEYSIYLFITQETRFSIYTGVIEKEVGGRPESQVLM